MQFNEPTNLGLSEDGHFKLKTLYQEKFFGQMADAYRFAVAYSLSRNIKAPDLVGNKQNIFGVATIDPSRELYNIVKLTIGESIQDSIYREIEKLAEFGISELYQKYQNGNLDIISMLKLEMES